MGKEVRCGPAARIRRRKNWSMHLVVVTVVGAALLVLDLYDGSPARAQTAKAVLVGAGDIASCESRGDRATAKLLDSIRGTVFTAGDDVYVKNPPCPTSTNATTVPGATTKSGPCR